MSIEQTMILEPEVLEQYFVETKQNICRLILCDWYPKLQQTKSVSLLNCPYFLISQVLNLQENLNF